MARKNYTTEQIIVKLRQVELLCGQGKTILESCRQTEIPEQTYYRWRKEYGGLNTSDAKRMKELEKENIRLKRLVAEQAFDICGGTHAEENLMSLCTSCHSTITARDGGRWG